MTDPSGALASFQTMLPQGVLPLQRTQLDPTVQVMMDEPVLGVLRFTYVRTLGPRATEMALLVTCEPIEGRPSFALGYAVELGHRGQGRAKSIVTAAPAEFETGMRRAGALPVYVEAVVGADNDASLRDRDMTLPDPCNSLGKQHRVNRFTRLAKRPASRRVPAGQA